MERSRLDESYAGQRFEDGPRLIEVNARGTGQHRFRKTENSSYLLQRGARHVVGETEVLHALMLDRQPERPRIPTPTTRASAVSIASTTPAASRVSSVRV